MIFGGYTQKYELRVSCKNIFFYRTPSLAASDNSCFYKQRQQQNNNHVQTDGKLNC